MCGLRPGVAETGREAARLSYGESWDGKGRATPAVLFLRYGMRYMAKVLKTTLEKKFPRATESEVYKASVVSPLPPPRPSFGPFLPVMPR